MKRLLVGASGAKKLCALGANGRRFCAAPSVSPLDGTMPRKRSTTVESALRALETGRPVPAFRALKNLALGGNEDAFHMLGYLYDVGEGTRRSRNNAMRWYLRSYHAGRAVSASNIATIYRDAGQPKREFEWYQRAADLGDGDARLEVAIRYLSGKGARRSISRALGHLKGVLKMRDTSEAARDTARQLIRGCEVKRRAV